METLIDRTMEDDFQGITIRTYQIIEIAGDYFTSERQYRDPFTPHQNVALFRHCGQAEGRLCHATVCHSRTLRDVMEDCLDGIYYLSEEYRKTILLQVTHGLKHLHNFGITHGHVTPTNILFPTNAGCRNIVLADFEGHDGDDCSMRRDIAQLANVFEYVLTNGDVYRRELQWRDVGIARRLLRDMRDENRVYSASDVLKHPFFWCDDKKINFLSRAVDIFENKKKMSKLDKKETYSDWTECLSLSPYESDECNRYLSDVRGLQMSCSKDAVKQRARKKHKDEKKTKLSELLKFFRNTKTHFCELVGPISWSFQDDETSRYWRFFAIRFPQLFYHVYDVMMEHELLNLKGVRDIYLETERENVPLPKLEDHVIQQELYEQDFRYRTDPDE